MEIQNISGLEKPLQKLIETVSEGVGVVANHLFEFDVAKLKRIGQAEAEIEKEKIIASAEAQERAVEVLTRAAKRLSLEQYTKQINLENILVMSREDLEGKTVSEEPVEKDWIMRFMDVAQNVSREEVQNVLAKILSGEIQRPGAFSYQGLETIKILSKEDLDAFIKFTSISTDRGVMKLFGNGKESLEKYGVDFGEYLKLVSRGLFNSSSTLNYDVVLEPQKLLNLQIGNRLLRVNNQTEATIKFDFGLYVYSDVGQELRLILIDDAINERTQQFINDFTIEAKKKNLTVSS